VSGRAGARLHYSHVSWPALQAGFGRALQREADDRRPFLWLPVAAGSGVLVYISADREPALWLSLLLAALSVGLAFLVRRRPFAFALSLGLAALLAGFCAGGWRSARVAAPILDHVRIVHLTGFIEEMDFRPVGARFVLRVASAKELAEGAVPFRVRLTMRQTPEFEAGSFVAVTARLLPPAHAALPGGYDFARDAYFERIGAVGSTLGRLAAQAAPAAPDTILAARMAIDRFRNALARRVDTIVGGDAGAVAAAMVTGKRDLLSDQARELIRQAGIFHIITISGVQMTLVAGILFFTVRRLLAFSRTLALRYPIKKWAALVAMAGACAYDIATGSRVGTERALFMTLIMLGSVLVDRRGFTMRNLAYAALFVIVLEPEAILGASFQLSFAAVAALVAFYEARLAAIAEEPPSGPGAWSAIRRGLVGSRRLLLATACATAATASFMAANFHELSPYVLIGNPLTLGLIELFAVPGALIGTALVPLGLDAPVWAYLGAGIRFILWVASYIGAAPGATLHLHAFAPWALIFLSLAVLSMVIWRTTWLRSTALPFFCLGLWGAMSGPRFDVLVLPSGDGVAVRDGKGKLGIVAAHANTFAAEQWVSADGDTAIETGEAGARCDRLGCVALLPDGRPLSLVLAPAAFEEDCARAAIVVTRLEAPSWCAASLVIDGDSLRRTGAVGLILAGSRFDLATARGSDSDRPWAPAPPPQKRWQPEEPRQPADAEGDEAGAVPPAPPEPPRASDAP
jgi:competence protein ComEC